MEEYLTTIELGKRIKMAPGTIRNLVWKGEFQENVHYLKPTPRKLLFMWSAIEIWLRRKCICDQIPTSMEARSLINI